MDQKKEEFFLKDEVTKEYREEKKANIKCQAMSQIENADYFIVLSAKMEPENLAFTVLVSVEGKVILNFVDALPMLQAKLLDTLNRAVLGLVKNGEQK